MSSLFADFSSFSLYFKAILRIIVEFLHCVLVLFQLLTNKRSIIIKLRYFFVHKIEDCVESIVEGPVTI